MSRLFGTDSAKGVAELSCELALHAGRAAAAVFSKGTGKKSKIIVAKDKKMPSDVLEAAVCAGVCSSGADVETLGAIPLSAAACLVSEHNADAGIMISAAHGGQEASGIRIFTPEGLRPDRETEEEIERLTLGGAAAFGGRGQGEIGRMLHCDTTVEEYVSRMEELSRLRLDGIRIAVSGEESAAGIPGVKLFRRLGAQVLEVREEGEPDTTGVERLMEFVTKFACDCGIALDGDGGGCLAVDEKGELMEGDDLLAVFARDLKSRGKLRHDSIVIPVTGGLSLRKFAAENGISTVSSGAGDRYVLDRMREGGYNLGGEKSGRIIFTDDLPCEDGLLCGMRLLEIMKSSGEPMSSLSGVIEKLPQVLINVRIAPGKKEIWKNDAEVTGLIREHQVSLGNEGRIVVRESGSLEPFICIIAEGKSFGQVNAIAVDIAGKIKERCGFGRKSRKQHG